MSDLGDRIMKLAVKRPDRALAALVGYLEAMEERLQALESDVKELKANPAVTSNAYGVFCAKHQTRMAYSEEDHYYCPHCRALTEARS